MNQIINLCVAAVLLVTSCKKVTGEGESMEESRPVSNFTSLVSSTGGKTYYTQGTNFSVKIKAQRNILDLIETPLENGELKVRFRNVNIGQHDQVQLYITAPDLSRLELQGSGELVATEEIANDDIEFAINGSGSINIARVTTGKLKTDINGSGDIIILTGNSDKTFARINGSGNTNLLSVSSKEADVFINGSGNIKIRVSDKLNAQISGSGNIYYKGTPLVDSRVSGSGKIQSLQ